MNIVTVTLLCLVIAQLAYSQEATQREKATVGHDEIIWQLRAAYAAFNRGDFDAAVATLIPRSNGQSPRNSPGGGTCHGREAVKKYLMQSGAA